ncbi:hypothetical protein [Aneurinibacillus migulanus]|jgi:hypothetical protein|uniref:Uncharacterized protein n=1 Tax=Aneurinibacillus migulanus TaxID=47500 RepID=A0A0D1XKN5_ANEMI|nr:hypothetical protein [Aneurinibacillus migulanus]KIV52808.1 hypothetical protein TS65_22010 [Aneurinibacillus migulanus]KON95078.1 hypothetical protein AF333_05865 [Aneurinibacillus migulanus]MED0895758.1 hypothetical protein [Aneurinibacillus migulanus]MED1614891.1 hypothetical protein [Aneurinibacillus migulanus]SDJ41374.1 hypothetical protein SAMN04487909_11766 [Aneurinibacillus migulanus]
MVNVHLVFFALCVADSYNREKCGKEWWIGMLSGVQIIYYILWFTVISGLFFMMIKILTSRD